MKKALLAFASMAGFICTAAADPAAMQADLRGYGKVSVIFAPERAEFTCESPEKAGILQGKMLADLFWDASDDQRAGKTVDSNGIKATLHEVPSYGAIIVGRLNNRVVALGGSNAEEVTALAAKEPMFRDPQCQFKADGQYPLYLDFFDLRAVKVYTHAFQSTRKEGLASHWPFLQQFGFGGISYGLGGGMLTGKSPAPGVLNTVDTDFEVAEAERNHGMIVPSLSVGGLLPLWATNEFPKSVVKLSPTGITEGGGLPLLESYGMPRNEREITGLWSLRELMRRYAGSPAVGGWSIYDGAGGIEADANYQATVDFSESGLNSFREYLRDTRKFDLPALGNRYFGDPGHYKSWNEVMPLDANGFFGDLDDSCLLLTNWQRHLADAGATQPPSNDDSHWQPTVIPGSDEMLTVPEADAFFRVDFDAKQWLSKNSTGDLYLVCGRLLAIKPPLKVWLNGKDLGEQIPEPHHGSFNSAVIKMNGLLQSGPNELVVWIPKGRFVSPFFLTPHKPEEYPSSSKTLNARYVDLKDWQFGRLGARHRDVFELARGLDPDRPFVMASGSGWEIADAVTDIATSLGVAGHNTGREGFYQPWWARLGRVAGFYGSSETSATTPGNIAQANSLNRLFGWLLIDGDSSHFLFWDIEDYIRVERETGWFTKNKRLLSLVGKALPHPPQVVVFRSSETMRYSPEHYNSAPWYWDLGRGELNAAHYNWGYASEWELHLGLPETCKVLVDSGSEVIDSSTIDAISAFVSNGGTFIALHNTGRSDPVDGNSWPISRLTGCKVVGEHATGKVLFESNLSLFKGWEGREFTVQGGPDAESIRLKPLSDEVKVLAKWDDGSAAVTSRPLGKGYVICLGSTFWRDAHDHEGSLTSGEGTSGFLERLFTDLGVERRSNASSPDIWVNDSTSKNGLDNWLIAFNTVRTPTTADLDFRADAKPAEVRELTTMTTVPFDYSDGWIHLKGVPFDNTETKVFAVKRADLADGLPFWWGEKTTYWKKCAVPAVQDQPHDAGALGTLQIDSWKFLADRDDKVSAQNDWNAPTFDDGSWGAIGTGPWNSLKTELKDYAGTGLYRTSFEIPAQWAGSSVSLNFFSGGGAPCILTDVRFNLDGIFLNGKKVGDASFYSKIKGVADRVVIDGLLVPGRNVLAVKIHGGATWGGELFSGFGGCVYLAAEKPLNPALELKEGWTCVTQDGNSSPIACPVARAKGKFLATGFTIPASWAGHEIFLRVKTETTWLGGIQVNDKILLSPGFRNLGSYVEMNVTSWVRPGEKVNLELWGNSLPLYNAFDPKRPPADAQMDLISASIGCVE